MYGMGELRTPFLHGHSVEEKKEELKQYFLQTMALYERLFDCINNDDAYYLRPEPLRHPLIFYYGHTATFFINKLMLGHFIDQRINERFESMFAIGVDEMSWDDLDNNHYDWPKVGEVADYREQVKNLVVRLIEKMPLDLPITENSLAWTILMGIEHERIHVETSSVIIRMLPLEHITPSTDWIAFTKTNSAPSNQLLPVTGALVTLGRGNDLSLYGWDNEFGEKEEMVKDFSASKYLVSNGEFLEFVHQGGYLNSEWWTTEGQQWLAYTRAEMPKFWRYRDGSYFQRNLLEEIPLPMNWPVEVNYLEAKAFCQWKSKRDSAFIRLPTEAEWMLLRNRISGDITDWQHVPGNINLAYGASSCPVDQFEQAGFYDVIGNVWQWTESLIDGFPGFKVHPLYDDFSTPTFDGQHNLIKGGSWISTGNLAIKNSRYAFRRHFFQHAGFRYIQTAIDDAPNQTVNVYETDQLVAQYLELHYGAEYFDVANFPVNCISHCMAYMQNKPHTKALDLGCSVGRSTFELAHYFTEVDGIDFSARFIQQAVKLQKEGIIRYTLPTEGDLVEFKEINLSSLGYDQVKKGIQFIQGDACNLKPQFTGYDLVFCGNLIDRLYDPALFLSTISQRLNPGGLLILTSPYTWLEQFTEKSKWLGGIKVNGENQTTLDGLKAHLSSKFKLLATDDVPFIIRETQRKFQHSIAQMTVWELL